MEPLLRVVNVSKTFGTLPVLDRLSLEVMPGEVVGLTGSVGSGKSVLVMMLGGLYEPDTGVIYFDNRRLTWPFAAQSRGIGVIHQQPTLSDHLNVFQNIFLGNEIGRPRGWGGLKFLDEVSMIQESARILEMLEVRVNSLEEKVKNLSIEQRQMIAIARVFTYPVKMVIIDEPTGLLSYPYQQKLLNLIQSWRQQGVAVLFSSNELDHLFAVTDRIITLHQKRKVADVHTDETNREEVVSLLVGTGELKKPSPRIWDFDSYSDLREHAEKLRYRQMMLEKDLAGEDALNRELTRQLAEQVEALDQANLALVEAQRRLLSEREEERKHLARELHDQVIQDLLSINYELEGMETEESAPQFLVEDMAAARQSIRDLVESLRDICGSLRPPTIDSLGLGAALKSYARDWSGRTGVQVNLDIDPKLGRLPEAIELSIFRVAQEGLSNVWRHAKANCVQISLQHTSPRTLMFSLQDDGLGLSKDFDLNELATDGHFGIVGISERVALLGGRFRFQPLPGRGSVLLVEIPHPRVEVDQKSAY